MHRNIPDGQTVLGSPAIPVREQRRLFQMIARLPEMHRQLRDSGRTDRGRDGTGCSSSGAREAFANNHGAISARGTGILPVNSSGHVLEARAAATEDSGDESE